MYRTNEPIVYVHDGKIVAVAAHRDVDLTDDQAAKLGEKVTKHPDPDPIFPKGLPIIDALRLDPAGEAEVVEEVTEKVARKVAK